MGTRTRTTGGSVQGDPVKLSQPVPRKHPLPMTDRANLVPLTVGAGARSQQHGSGPCADTSTVSHTRRSLGGCQLSAHSEAQHAVGVIGLGRVGRAVCDLLAAHVRLVTWDRAENQPYPEAELAACDYAVVCVDTPAGTDGTADLSSVMKAAAQVPCERVLLKSTVPPGTTNRLAQSTGKSICYWPEYIGESRYYNPVFPSRIIEVPFVIIGGEPVVRRWFIDRLLPILGPTKTYFQCEAVEAELIKYAENSYFATKITFVNEFRQICEAFAADWHTVREGWLLDPRVERMHTAAFDDEPGFGGKCLPKDMTAIVAAAAAKGYMASLLAEVLATNARLRGISAGPGAGDAEPPAN